MANYQNITPVKLGQAAMTTGYTTLYTTPANSRTYVKQFDIVNTSATPTTFYVHIAPTASTEGVSNAIFYNAPIAGNTTVQWTGVEIMNVDNAIRIKAGAATCTISASGGEAV